MALYDRVLEEMRLLTSLDPEMILTHDIAPVMQEMQSNDAERPAVVVRDAGGVDQILEFPYDPAHRQGQDFVEVQLYFPIRDETPEEWEAARRSLQSDVQAGLRQAITGRLATITWSGWRNVLLDGTASPSYTSVTARLAERIW